MGRTPVLLALLLAACRERPEDGSYSGTVEFPDVAVGSLVGGRVLEVHRREGEAAANGDVPAAPAAASDVPAATDANAAAPATNVEVPSATTEVEATTEAKSDDSKQPESSN